MPDATTNAILLQLGAVGILGLGLVWVAKWLVPRALQIVEKMIADHKSAMEKMGQDHKQAVQEMCETFSAETSKCHEERISDRAERVSEAVEGRRVLTDLTVATNKQTAVLGTIASRLKVEGP